MIVLFWSRATRELLRSFGWGIAALHLKRAGVAIVVIEPLVYEAAPVIAAVQPAGAAATQ